jgi:hypothetical protein
MPVLLGSGWTSLVVKGENNVFNEFQSVIKRNYASGQERKELLVYSAAAFPPPLPRSITNNLYLCKLRTRYGMLCVNDLKSAFEFSNLTESETYPSPKDHSPPGHQHARPT